MLIDNQLLAIFSPQAQDFLHLICRACGHEDRWWRHKVVQHQHVVFRSSMHPIDRRPQQLVGCRQMRKSAISPPCLFTRRFYCWTRRLVIRTASLLFARHRWKEATNKKCDFDFTMNMIIHFPTVDCHLLDGKQLIYLYPRRLQNEGGVRCFTCNTTPSSSAWRDVLYVHKIKFSWDKKKTPSQQWKSRRRRMLMKSLRCLSRRRATIT